MSIDPVVLQVLRLRSAATRITAGKLSNALASVTVDDKRLRDMGVYYGAHTGRFTGRKVQIQNLPRGVDEFSSEGYLYRGEATWERLEKYRGIAEEIRQQAGTKNPEVPIDAAISSLIRPCFTAGEGNVLLVSDYNAIELRGVAKLAGEQGLLDALRNGEDIYRSMASRLYGVPPEDITDLQRWVGKQIILGCGYQMSAAKFDLMVSNFGVSLEAAGVTAEQCIEAFRSVYPAIAGVVAGEYNGRPYWRGGVWHQFGNAVLACVADGTAGNLSGCAVSRDGRNLVIALPSGRPIIYRNARIELLRARMAGKPVGDPKPTVVYDHPRGYVSVLFGGKIVENVVQGMCRDLLVCALIQCERAGLCPVFHVHDEIVCEVDKEAAGTGLRTLTEIMSEKLPWWATGFPVAVKGYITERYVKK